jgi:DnaK suppressor protein
MEQAEVERFRSLLLEKRTELLDRVRAARTSEHEEGKEGAPDLGDRALETVSRDLLYRLSTGERETLRRVDLALKRLEKAEFGTCVNCGREVQPGRLQAVPWALHCIDCQELQDRGEI